MTSSVTTKSDTPVVLDSVSILVTPPIETLVDLKLGGNDTMYYHYLSFTGSGISTTDSLILPCNILNITMELYKDSSDVGRIFNVGMIGFNHKMKNNLS